MLTQLPTPLILLSLLSLARPSTYAQSFTLEKDYFPNFFENFDFFDGADPTSGTVIYNGQNNDLISESDSVAQWTVDTTDQVTVGRQSIRITSKEAYDKGLIIADISHMPGGICGTWPAFWTFGQNWPSNGEIDIIENVNNVQTNQMTLHTGNSNSGCGITTTDTATYGTAFNQNQGGVYATLIGDNSIQVWFWPRSQIPADITASTPDPSTWSTPIANFTGDCDISSVLGPQNLVFDTTFCGDWGNSDWGSSTCSNLAPTCSDYVLNNGAAFQNAYWTVKGLKVFQEGTYTTGSTTDPTPSTTATTAIASVATVSPLSSVTSTASSMTTASSVLTKPGVVVSVETASIATSIDPTLVGSIKASIVALTHETSLVVATPTSSSGMTTATSAFSSGLTGATSTSSTLSAATLTSLSGPTSTTSTSCDDTTMASTTTMANMPSVTLSVHTFTVGALSSSAAAEPSPVPGTTTHTSPAAVPTPTHSTTSTRRNHFFDWTSTLTSSGRPAISTLLSQISALTASPTRHSIPLVSDRPTPAPPLSTTLEPARTMRTVTRAGSQVPARDPIQSSSAAPEPPSYSAGPAQHLPNAPQHAVHAQFTTSRRPALAEASRHVSDIRASSEPASPASSATPTPPGGRFAQASRHVSDIRVAQASSAPASAPAAYAPAASSSSRAIRPAPAARVDRVRQQGRLRPSRRAV